MWILKKLDGEPFLERNTTDTLILTVPPPEAWPLRDALGQSPVFSLPHRKIPVLSVSRVLEPADPIWKPVAFRVAVPEPLDVRHGVQITLCFSRKMAGFLITHLTAAYTAERALALTMALTGDTLPEPKEG